ncbi:alpha/beta fold hydrolase [Luteipulveratus halotolerans]|uniref:Alpha/beta hydrolase n=1 Tax=Luteipulveratus halotolerans TaxID=1631356 RepID=A0A0L6CE12_9MICO|nr:alpha/beta hydrolase [Luteipulveratus halotolerans]KNX36106.1 alpha/beta hydrolase [Luteipulveratus halotolerans]
MPSPADVSRVLIDGPWQHRFVAANGARFHVAESGEGPLVVLLHGFPEFWWAWRDQIPALADAGHRVAALDLRGYGASDKPPQGYDTFTLAADVAAVIRCLGERQATVVGHGWGGWIAWSMASMQPDVTRAVASLGMPHPLVLRQASARSMRQVRANAYLFGLQRPFVPERQMVAGPRYVRRLMSAWSGRPGWPSGDVSQLYADALTLPFVAHSAAEYYRWVMRSVMRSDGRRFVARLSQPVGVPVLHVHGESDGCVLPESSIGSQQWCSGRYDETLLPGVGHFIPEEAPDATNRLLIDWLGSLSGS